MRVQAGGAVRGALASSARRLQVSVASTSELRTALSGPLASVRSRRVTIEVGTWQPPRPGWAGRLGPLPGVLRHELRLPERSGAAVIQVRLSTALPFDRIATAALAALTPTSRLPLPVSPDVVAYGQSPQWLPRWSNLAGVVGDAPDEQIIRPYDLLLADGVSEAGVDGRVIVDATIANPHGYSSEVVVDASLTTSGDAFAIEAVLTGPLGVLTPDQISAVRALRSVHVRALTGYAPQAEAALLVQLAMTGVVVYLPQPSAVAGLVAAGLLDIMAEPLPTKAFEWEARSVRQRRVAVREHATAFVVPTLAGLPGNLSAPSVSAILVVPPGARPRLSTLTYPALEVVVAARSSTMDDLNLGEVRVVEVPDDCGDEEAFAMAVSRSTGSLITCLEIDARYGEGHIWDLVSAMYFSGATVVGKAPEFTESGSTAVSAIRQASECFVESISDGAVLVRRGDLTAAGGWPRTASGPGYRTHPFGYVRPQSTAQEPDGVRSTTEIRTLPLTVATS